MDYKKSFLHKRPIIRKSLIEIGRYYVLLYVAVLAAILVQALTYEVKKLAEYYLTACCIAMLSAVFILRLLKQLEVFQSKVLFLILDTLFLSLVTANLVIISQGIVLSLIWDYFYRDSNWNNIPAYILEHGLVNVSLSDWFSMLIKPVLLMLGWGSLTNVKKE